MEGRPPRARGRKKNFTSHFARVAALTYGNEPPPDPPIEAAIFCKGGAECLGKMGLRRPCNRCRRQNSTLSMPGGAPPIIYLLGRSICSTIHCSLGRWNGP